MVSIERGKTLEKQRIAVLGPGSWGTALAQVLAENGHEVTIWGNKPTIKNQQLTLHRLLDHQNEY